MIILNEPSDYYIKLSSRLPQPLKGCFHGFIDSVRRLGAQGGFELFLSVGKMFADDDTVIVSELSVLEKQILLLYLCWRDDELDKILEQ